MTIGSVARRRALALSVLGIAVWTSTACEPCSGMGSCFTNPHLSLIGVLRDDVTGVPVSGARVDFVRQSGVALAADSVRTVTDAGGNFLLTVQALASGEVMGEVIVRGPAATGGPAFEYRVLDLTFDTFIEVGDAHVLPPWSTRPSLPDLAQLLNAGSPLSNVTVEFRRTGGVRLAEGDVYRTTTDNGGVLPLFQGYVRPLDAGEVVGDLFVEGVLALRGLRLRATPHFRPNVVLRPVDIASGG